MNKIDPTEKFEVLETLAVYRQYIEKSDDTDARLVAFGVIDKYGPSLGLPARLLRVSAKLGGKLLDARARGDEHRGKLISPFLSKCCDDLIEEASRLASVEE